jgi:hypothetical protein
VDRWLGDPRRRVLILLDAMAWARSLTALTVLRYSDNPGGFEWAQLAIGIEIDPLGLAGDHRETSHELIDAVPVPPLEVAEVRGSGMCWGEGQAWAQLAMKSHAVEAQGAA